MNTDRAYKLVGFSDPGGISLGFLVPLFSDGRNNAVLIQLTDENGDTCGFEPYGASGAAVLQAPAMELSIGEPAIHAFAFDKGDVEVANNADLTPFSARLDDPALAKRPLVAMELADFLNQTDRRCEFAALAHAEMRRASDETADYWRDLSVLTVEMHRELVQSPYRSARQLANAVVARVFGNVVEITGVGARPDAAQFASLKNAGLAALATLSLLYPTPSRGWEVRLRWQQYRERGKAYDAALLLASPRAVDNSMRAAWPDPPRIEIFTRDGQEFTRLIEETETPVFVAYDSGEPEQMRRAQGDWTVREMHGIGLNAPRRLPQQAEGQHWRTTHIPGTGIRGGASQAERGIVSGLRLAIAAELDRRAEDISWLPNNTLLLRARGLGTDPMADAWATLYDRAWALGTAPWKSLLLQGPKRMPVLSEREAGWVEETLFQEPRYVGRNLVRRVMEGTRSTAALWVDASQRSEEDAMRHRSSITRLLERQEWKISDREARADLVIEGQHGRIDLAFSNESNRSTTSEKFDLNGIDLRSIDRVVLTSAASPSAVLERLVRTRELAVDVRDLVGLDAREATILSLFGAQLRRLISGLTSRSRTRFLAVLCMQAFRWGRMEAEDAALLQDSLHSEELGQSLQLTVSSTRSVDGGGTVAEVRLLTHDTKKGERNWKEGTRYRLMVYPETIAITDA